MQEARGESETTLPSQETNLRLFPPHPVFLLLRTQRNLNRANSQIGAMEPPQSPLAGDVQAEASPVASPIPDRRSPSPELPLTMTASVVLSSLPRDATSALAAAGKFTQEKVLVRFKPVGAAPSLSREVCKISAAQKFEAVVAYLRRVLKVKDTDSVFLYVNSAFAPSLDEIVGNLHRVSYAPLARSASKLTLSQCFKNAHDQLVVAYSLTPAFG